MFDSYQQHVETADIINQAGRQRMYSQKIAKLTLYYNNGDLYALQELRETVTRWSLTHRSFMDENSSLSKFYFSNPLIRQNFEELDVSQKAIENAVNEIIANPQASHAEAVAVVMEHERRFLVIMDTIVNQMESESGRSYYRATILEILIAIFTFLGITSIVFFLLVPTIKELTATTSGLTTSVNEKDALLSEIHHRVKNNLAIVSGIFQLQIFNRNFTQATFENAVNRVQSIASIHEFLYSDNEFSSVKIDQYINELVKRLSVSYSELGNQIRVNVISDSILFKVDKAAPFALLLNELITNSLKHAYRPGDLGQIDITLTESRQGFVRFTYQDNGSGAKYSSKDSTGIGMQLIYALSDQLGGKLEIDYSPSFSLKTSFEVD